MSVDDERCHFVLVPLEESVTMDVWLSPDPAARSKSALSRLKMIVGLAGRKPGELGWTHPQPATLSIEWDQGRFGVEHGDVNRWYKIPADCHHDDPLLAAECLADTWLNDYDSLIS